MRGGIKIGVGKREGMENFFKWGRGDENLGWGGRLILAFLSSKQWLRLCVDGGIPKNLEVGGIYDFFCHFGVQGGGEGFGIYSIFITFLMITYLMEYLSIDTEQEQVLKYIVHIQLRTRMQAVPAMPTVCEQIKSQFSVSLDSEADHLTTFPFLKGPQVRP